MTRLTVQAFENGSAVGEYVAHSQTMNEQQMADYMLDRVRDGIGLRFLGDGGIVEPTACKLPAITL